jgi:hypothetical protein
MPYPMESGIDMMAADTAPERSPLKFARYAFKSMVRIPKSGQLRKKRSIKRWASEPFFLLYAVIDQLLDLFRSQAAASFTR